ncbi:MAG: DNA-binding protein [Candidatus Altiarchaeota archaeon]|nr:DNA-binding protein [Candidatus Altiarchaeota archaeon]
MSASELEEIRKRRFQELMQQQMQQQVQRGMQEEQLSSQISHIINQILEPDARERLANIRVARPDYARQVEVLLIQLYQAGQLPQKLSDENFRKILERIQSRKKETKISRV